MYDEIYALAPGEETHVLIEDDTGDVVRNRIVAALHAWQRRRGMLNTPERRHYVTRLYPFSVCVRRVK